jgi:signal transduction histidine kinase
MIFLASIKSDDVIVLTVAGIILIMMLFGFILYFIFSYRHKQRDFILLQIHKNKIDSQKELLEKTLHDLKAAQVLLVQSEKMASLGTLTAGIAHEIQNPLNFVTNFSEVNKDLLADLRTELELGNMPEAKAITADLIDNENKINHHGLRAAAIVKSMLQHSHSSSGALEPTNINALADEYLRLAYHGFRAKDKSFNATLKTDFDENIGMIKVIPQDIARVILNLITNAFYAITEKAKSITQSPIGDKTYEPTLIVKTSKRKSPSGDAWVVISIRDNGPGIPQSALDKIFEPFYTTKPPGEGTGLGLSLSYDIIKAHGGELKVETKAGEFAEFIITLPTK